MNECEINMVTDGIVKDYFPQRLKDLRVKAQLTQKEFADEIGISVAALSYYETGKRFPDIAVFSRIYTFFNVPAEYLLGSVDSYKKENVNISEKLHISDTAIEKIGRYTSEAGAEYDFDGFRTVLNYLLESDDFYSAIDMIAIIALDKNDYIDSEYFYYLSTKKLCSAIKKICQKSDVYFNFPPISEDKEIVEDYENYLNELCSEHTRVEEQIREYYEHQNEMINMLHEQYKQTKRYKALENIKKEASEDGKHNPPKE